MIGGGLLASAAAVDEDHLLAQASLPRSDHGLRTIGHLQLVEDVAHVVSHRLQAEDQVLGNRAVRAAGELR